MFISAINTISFGIYQNTRKVTRDWGTLITDTGKTKDKKIEIFNAYNKQGRLEHKLYYLQDLVGNWLKSKLVFFSEAGKKYKTLYSHRNERRNLWA